MFNSETPASFSWGLFILDSNKTRNLNKTIEKFT